MGPGAEISIAAGSCKGMVVCVKVGWGLEVSVGLGVRVGAALGVSTRATSVPILFAEFAVSAITVGRYSGGYAVGMGLAIGAAQPARSPRSEAMMRILRVIQRNDCHCEESFSMTKQPHIK